MKSEKLKGRIVFVILVVLSTIYSVFITNVMVQASELDGYTIVDWTQNRDMETTESNSVTVGGNANFWRYVNDNNPAGNDAIWKSEFGDELSDQDVTDIWNGIFGDKYITASVSIDSIPDERIRNYIYEHVDEYVPDLKLKFDVDLDVPGDTSKDKAESLFKGDVGYRVVRDGDTCIIEIKFNPKFQLTKNSDTNDLELLLPNMPNKKLPRAKYPYSSVIFSMWGKTAGSDEHHGALEVIEGDDPRYIYGQSFGYGDILEKGKIPENMIYPNFTAGQINEEGVWTGTIQSDTLDSNRIRIGQQYKSAGDLWYYSYGGAVGYSFKFPIKVTMSVPSDEKKITKRVIDTITGEMILENTYNMNEVSSKSFILANNKGQAIIEDDSIDKEYIYTSCEVVNGVTGEILEQSNSSMITIEVNDSVPYKILNIYVQSEGIQSPPTPTPTTPTNPTITPSPNPTPIPGTVPIDPPMCDSHTDTITWEEQESHTAYDDEGDAYTCYHTYEYEAKLTIEEVNVSPEALKSGYGVDVNIKTSVSYRQTGKSKSRSFCNQRLSNNRTPTNEPVAPVAVDARLGWETKTFGGTFIQGSTVSLERVSWSGEESEFSAPYNDVVGENKLYTDIYLSGTNEEPRSHKISFDIYGGGVDDVEWCTSVDKYITINGDMYEDDGTTST